MSDCTVLVCYGERERHVKLNSPIESKKDFPSESDIQKIAKAVLLSPDEVKMWCEHLQENRKQGALKLPRQGDIGLPNKLQVSHLSKHWLVLSQLMNLLMTGHTSVAFAMNMLN